MHNINPANSVDPTDRSAARSVAVEDRDAELWLFRVFAAVADTRSMTLAGNRMGLTQSAVSQAVRRLERAMGVELVERGKRPIVLTAAGGLLERRGSALLRDAARLPHELREAARLPANEIRLGLVDSFAATAGPRLILALSNEATRVVIWSGLAPSLGASLMAREVDLLVTPDPMEDVGDLVRWVLWREPFVLVVPRPMAQRARGLTLQSLASELPIVRFSARSYTGMQVDRHLRRVGVALERRIEVDGADALVAMVAAGVGWALATPLCLLQGLQHAAHVQALPLPPPRFSRTLTMVCREDGPAAFAARAALAAAEVLQRDCMRLLQAAPSGLAGLADMLGTTGSSRKDQDPCASSASTT